MPPLFVLSHLAILLPEFDTGEVPPAVVSDELWSWLQNSVMLCLLLLCAFAWSTTKLAINAVANTTAITPKTNCLFMVKSHSKIYYIKAIINILTVFCLINKNLSKDLILHVFFQGHLYKLCMFYLSNYFYGKNGWYTKNG